MLICFENPPGITRERLDQSTFSEAALLTVGHLGKRGRDADLSLNRSSPSPQLEQDSRKQIKFSHFEKGEKPQKRDAKMPAVPKFVMPACLTPVRTDFLRFIVFEPPPVANRYRFGEKTSIFDLKGKDQKRRPGMKVLFQAS